MAFRSMQLELRVQEVYEAYHSFKGVINGDVKPVVHETTAEQADAFVDSIRDRVNVEDTSITGHSFGGATIVRCLLCHCRLDPPRIAFRD